MSELVWQDPPVNATDHVGRRAQWLAEAEQMRANPKRWALIKVAASANAAGVFCTQARQGKKAAFRPPHEWEILRSGAEIYIRYVGEALGES